VIVVLVVAVLVVLGVGVAALVAGRRSSVTGGGLVPAPDPAAVARARSEAERAIGEARNQALATREAVHEEVRLRNEAVEAGEALLDERERTYRDRRAVFDDRRHLHKKRREEIDERIAAVAAARADMIASFERVADLDRQTAAQLVLERTANELAGEHLARVESALAERVGDAEPAARTLIAEAMERQLSGHDDGATRAAPLSLEDLDEHGRERLLSALSVIAEETGMELGIDEDRAQATLRGMDPIGREVARQAALEVVDRKLQAAEVPSLLTRTRGSLQAHVRQRGEQALWEMQMEGRPELAELIGTLHYRFSYGQNALLPSLAFVELTRPDQVGDQRYQRGRDDGLRAPAVPIGERNRLAAEPPGRGERARLRRETELRQASDFEVGPADPPGQDGALPEVALGVWQPQRPRLNDPQIHQRHRPQVAARRDVLVGLPGHRGGKESDLLNDAGKVTAPPRQPQLQRRDRHPEAALAIHWRRLGVRLGDYQVDGRLVQASLDEVNCCVHQGQLGVIRALREGPQQRLDGRR